MSTLSETDRKLIRRQTGDDTTTLPDDDLNLLVADAADEYADYSGRVQRQAVIVARFRELRANAAGEVSYSEGGANEKLSDLYKHLDKQTESAEARLQQLIDDADSTKRSSVRILGARRGRRKRSRPYD